MNERMSKQTNKWINKNTLTNKKKQTHTPHVRQKIWCPILKIETVTMR